MVFLLLPDLRLTRTFFFFEREREHDVSRRSGGTDTAAAGEKPPAAPRLLAVELPGLRGSHCLDYLRCIADTQGHLGDRNCCVLHHLQALEVQRAVVGPLEETRPGRCMIPTSWFPCRSDSI